MRKSLILTLALLLCVALGCGQQQPTAESVAAKNVEAIGGAEKLAATTDQVSHWNFTMTQMPPMPEGEGEMEGMEGMADGEGMSMPMVITYKRPNMLRFDFTDAEGNIVSSSCYNGTTGWATHGGVKMDFNEAQMHENEVMAATWLDGYHNYEEKGMSLALLENETVDGEEYLVLETTDKYGTKQKHYIDPETYLVKRQAGDMTNYEGKLEPMVMVLSEYTEVDGLMMPAYVAQHTADGEMLWEAELVRASHNTGVEDEAFMPDAMTAM